MLLIFLSCIIGIRCSILMIFFAHFYCYLSSLVVLQARWWSLMRRLLQIRERRYIISISLIFILHLILAIESRPLYDRWNTLLHILLPAGIWILANATPFIFNGTGAAAVNWAGFLVYILSGPWPLLTSIIKNCIGINSILLFCLETAANDSRVIVWRFWLPVRAWTSAHKIINAISTAM